MINKQIGIQMQSASLADILNVSWLMRVGKSSACADGKSHFVIWEARAGHLTIILILMNELTFTKNSYVPDTPLSALHALRHWPHTTDFCGSALSFHRRWNWDSQLGIGLSSLWLAGLGLGPAWLASKELLLASASNCLPRTGVPEWQSWGPTPALVWPTSFPLQQHLLMPFHLVCPRRPLVVVCFYGQGGYGAAWEVPFPPSEVPCEDGNILSNLNNKPWCHLRNHCLCPVWLEEWKFITYYVILLFLLRKKLKISEQWPMYTAGEVAWVCWHMCADVHVLGSISQCVCAGDMACACWCTWCACPC